LGRFSLVKFGLRPATGGRPFKTGFSRGIDHHDNVAHRPPTGLQKQRGVEHHRRLTRSGEFVALAGKALSDSRMEQVFEKLALRGRPGVFAKYPTCDRGPVNVAVFS
jgi:hypothetical protein